METSSHWTKRLAVVAFLVAVLFAIAWVVADGWEFWSATTPSRVAEIQEAVSDGVFLGMSMEQLVRTLGTPPSKRQFRGWDNAFWLAEQSLFPVDSHWLVVKLKGERVVAARVIED